MNSPIILGKTHDEILGEVGLALLQVKCARKMTLIDIGKVIGRTDDMVAKYISGEAEMGAVALLYALAAFPELKEKIGGLV
jgi:hypothetical protein